MIDGNDEPTLLDQAASAYRWGFLFSLSLKALFLHLVKLKHSGLYCWVRRYTHFPALASLLHIFNDLFTPIHVHPFFLIPPNITKPVIFTHIKRDSRFRDNSFVKLYFLEKPVI